MARPLPPAPPPPGAAAVPGDKMTAARPRSQARYRLNVRPDASESELSVAVARHFESITVDEEAILGRFFEHLDGIDGGGTYGDDDGGAVAKVHEQARRAAPLLFFSLSSRPRAMIFHVRVGGGQGEPERRERVVDPRVGR